MSNTFLQDQKSELEAIIKAYQTAILQLGLKGIQSYKLDTGQSVQWVTKLDVKDLTETLDGLYNTYTMLCARGTGSGTLNVRPAF